MTYYIDIDGTICRSKYPDYHIAYPFLNRIHRINELYNSGNTIVYYTARGVGSNWLQRIFIRDLTRKQLKMWGCKYHKLSFKKPLFDLFVDDRAVSDMEFFK